MESFEQQNILAEFIINFKMNTMCSEPKIKFITLRMENELEQKFLLSFKSNYCAGCKFISVECYYRRKKHLCKNIWPIDTNSAKPPENWQGWPDGKKIALVLTHDVDR